MDPRNSSSIAFAVRQCAARASTLSVLKHSQRKKKKQKKNGYDLIPLWDWVEMLLRSKRPLYKYSCPKWHRVRCDNSSAYQVPGTSVSTNSSISPRMFFFFFSFFFLLVGMKINNKPVCFCFWETTRTAIITGGGCWRVQYLYRTWYDRTVVVMF